MIETMLNISRAKKSKTVTIIIKNGDSISLPQASILSILSCAWRDFQIYIESNQKAMKIIERQIDETFFFTSKIQIVNDIMNNPDLVISKENVLPKNALKKALKGKKCKIYDLDDNNKKIDYPQRGA